MSTALPSNLRYLITGASGQLGRYMLREAARRGLTVRGWSQNHDGPIDGIPVSPVELSDPAALSAAFRSEPPDVILHAGAMASIAAAYADPERAHRVNVQGTTTLADLAARAGARMVYVSSDLVFDGTRGGYREADAPAPLSVYGRTKAEGEPAVLAAPRGLVVRVSLMFGPSLSGRPGFFDQQLAAIREGRPMNLFEDEWRTPLSLRAAAQALLDLCRSDYTGILHLGGPERMSRLEMGRRLAAWLRSGGEGIVPTRQADHPAPEPRPRDVSLDSGCWRALFPEASWPGFEVALGELLSIP